MQIKGMHTSAFESLEILGVPTFISSVIQRKLYEMTKPY